jgi:hypothetical protein
LLVDNINATISSRSTLTAAQVNTEADQALADVGLTPTVTGRIDAAISTRSTLTTAQVNAEADTALADVGLTSTVTGRIDAAVSTRSTLTAADVWSDASRTLTSFGTLAADVWAVATRTITGGTVSTVGDKTGYSLSTAGVAAIWDALLTGIATVGSIGKLIKDNLDTTISSRSTLTAAQVNTEADTALADVGLTSTVTGRIDATISSRLATSSYTAPPSVGAIDSQLSGTHGAGSWATATGFATPANVTDARDAVIDAVPTVGEIDSQLSGTHGAGSWATATGFATPDDLDALATPADIAPVLVAIDALDVVAVGQSGRPETVGELVVVRASTFTASVTLQSIPGDWSELRFTVKRGDSLLDDDGGAVLQILLSNPGGAGDGLLVVNGTAAALVATPADGALTVTGSVVDIRVEDDVTALLYPDNYVYDLKFYHGSSESGLPYPGRLKVVATATQTV